MFIDNDCVHTDADGTVIYLTDTDTSDILIIINGADQYLGVGFRIALRRGDIVEDRLEQRFHIAFFIREVENRDP